MQIESLIRTLDNPRPDLRREALMELAAIGPQASQAIPSLIDCLQDSDPVIRAYAARAAWRIGVDPEILLPVLIEFVDVDQPQLFGVAVLVLGNIGPEAKDALPVLQDFLKAKAPVDRVRAAESIVMIDCDNDAALQVLTDALQDGESETRYLAVNALGTAAIAVADEHAIYALEMALADADPSVAAAAGTYLFRLQDRPPDVDRPIPVGEEGPSPAELRALIADLSHSSAVIRRMSAVRLGMAGPSAQGAAETLHALLDDDDPTVQVAAANAVWSIEREPDDIVPLLTELLDSENPSVSIAAAYVLGRMRLDSYPSLPVLRERLAFSEGVEHLLLAAVVSRIDPGDQVVLGMLLADLHHSEGDVRYLSALVLADAPEDSHRRIQKELSAALSDQNLRVQSAARESLCQLGSRLPKRSVAGAACRRSQAASSPIVTAPLPRNVPAQGDAPACDQSTPEQNPPNRHVSPSRHYSFTEPY